MSTPYEGDSSDATTPGITGTYQVKLKPIVADPVAAVGVYGVGVYGVGDYGVVGTLGPPPPLAQLPVAPNRVAGVYGFSPAGTSGSGVFGLAAQFDGVHGESQSNQHAGVSGVNNSGGMGVYGSSSLLDGVQGWSAAPNNAGVSARNTSNGNGTLPSGFALWAKANATAIYGEGNPAGYFKGDVLVTGDLVLVNSSSADIAEDFDVEDEEINLAPGTVLIINGKGKLCASNLEYDTRVAGVVSGAGALKPAVVLQRVSSPTPRSPIALLGKVFCKADATSGSIAAGDLLTTSGRRGYAMKVSDKSRAFGAILGKALAPISNGIGIIPILVTLR